MAAAGLALETAQAATLTTVFRFNDSNGSSPSAGLIGDASGNLYGLTTTGGPGGRGLVYELSGATTATNASPAAQTVLATFSAGSGGLRHLIADPAGNLYGANRSDGGGNGSIFKIAGGMTGTPGPMTTLASFDGSNGKSPTSLIADAAGNLYGTTTGNGISSFGTVFKIAGGATATPGPLVTLAVFNQTNGATPDGELVLDKNGNLFGTTFGGGASNVGTAYRISAANTATPGPLTTVLTFNTANATEPHGGLIADGQGNLYGAAAGGPTFGGTVFKISGAATASAASPASFTRLASFDFLTQGATPNGGLIADAEGNLFGTTWDGGSNFVGTVFKLGHAFGPAPEPITVLATFTNIANASVDRLYADASGDLYGTTVSGSTFRGAVFRVRGTGFVVPTSPVPEPGTWALWQAGLGWLMGRARPRCG